MLEILKSAYKNPNALSQSKHYNLINRGEMPKYFWELFPLAGEYYHEFNPYYVHTIPEHKLTVFPAFKVFTVRDGYIAFADFLLKYWREIPKWKTIFLIPELYAPMIPENLYEYFLCYATTQAKTPDFKKAKTVTVLGLLTNYYFGNYEAVEAKLGPLKDLPPTTKIEICLSMRRCGFIHTERENLHWVRIPEIIRKVLGDREVSYVRMSDFMERSTFYENILIDLRVDDAFSCDSFHHYNYLARGGVINELNSSDLSKKSLFEIDISFGQKLCVLPFPKCQTQFGELIFFQKLNRGELWSNLKFHELVRNVINVPVFAKDPS